MVTISKNSVNGNTSFTNYISSEQNKILYKVVINDVTQFAFKLDIQAIQNRADFSEQSFWGIDIRAINEYNQLSSNTQEEVFYEVDQKFIVNLLRNSLPQRSDSLHKASDFAVQDLVMFLPYTTNTADDITFRLVHNEGSTSITNIASTGDITEFEHNTWKNIITPIEDVSSEIIGDAVRFTVSTDPKITKLYLEQVNGILPKTSLSLVNGQTSFNVLTTGLDTGDTVKVKVGYKYFTGVLDLSFVI